jgi:hypothetical protein
VSRLTSVAQEGEPRVAWAGGQLPEGWEFDLEAIQDAADSTLGIRWPILLRYYAEGGRGDDVLLGQYATVERGCHGDPSHSILVSVYNDRTQASSVIWHELTHAMQRERGDKDIPLVAELVSRESYLAQPAEREAEEVAARHAGEVLTKPVMVDAA